jgi:hypothetical protein
MSYSESSETDITNSLSSSTPTIPVGALTTNNAVDTPQSTPASAYYSNTPLYTGNEEAQLLQTSLSVGIADPTAVQGHGVWETPIVSPGPNWWLAYNFDLDALNTSVSATMDLGGPLFQHHQTFEEAGLMPGPDVVRRPDIQRVKRPINDVVKRSWFTQIEGANNEEDHTSISATRPLTPVTDRERHELDDNFRTSVSLRLRPRINDDPLPSTIYLVRQHCFEVPFCACLQVYRTCPFRLTLRNLTQSFL